MATMSMIMLRFLLTVVLCTWTVEVHYHESLMPKGWGEVQRVRVVPPENRSSPLVNAAVVDHDESLSGLREESRSSTTSSILEAELGEDGKIVPVLPNRSQFPSVVQFVWRVYNFTDIVNLGQDLLFSPRFYLSTDQPANRYRLQLLLVTNTTYLDNISYLGVFFRIVAGDYDASLEWPYKYRTVLSVLEHDQLDNATREASVTETILDMPIRSGEWNHTVVPNIDECRLRSAFLRPNSDSDTGANTDGCGNRRHIPLNQLRTNRYIFDDTLLVLVTVHLTEVDKNAEQLHFHQATMSMRYNELVSNFVWTVQQFHDKEHEATEKGRIAILTSHPFYTHPNGYLIQLFLTILPKRNAFAISIAFMQGDYDRYLTWPFPYAFEMAIVDQSPDYWQRDLMVKMKPSKSDCGTETFGQPSQQPEFCFLTIQSLQVLSLTHYNFLINDTLKIRFTTRFERYSARQRSSILLHNGRLVSEFNWLIPGLVARFERYIQESSNVPSGASSPTSSASSATRRSHKFISDEFYTNGQGYLCQLQLTVTVRNVPLAEMHNATTTPSDGETAMNKTSRSIDNPYSNLNDTPRMFSTSRAQPTSQDVLVFGLELVIIEGEYDRLLDWPWSHAYELAIVGYKNLDGTTTGANEPSGSEPLLIGGQLYTVDSPPPKAEFSSDKRTSSTLVIPSQQITNGQCTKEAFQKPIERNPPCGIREFVQLTSTEESRRQRQAKRPRSKPFSGTNGPTGSQFELGTLSGKSEEDLHLRVRIYM